MYGLCGEQGAKGDNGITPHIGENGNWYVGDKDTGVQAQGKRGMQGFQGIQGIQGIQGVKGEKGENFVVCDTTFAEHTIEQINAFSQVGHSESFHKADIVLLDEPNVYDIIGLFIPCSDTGQKSLYIGQVEHVTEESIVCDGRGAIHSGLKGAMPELNFSINEQGHLILNIN